MRKLAFLVAAVAMAFTATLTVGAPEASAQTRKWASCTAGNNNEGMRVDISYTRKAVNIDNVHARTSNYLGGIHRIEFEQSQGAKGTLSSGGGRSTDTGFRSFKRPNWGGELKVTTTFEYLNPYTMRFSFKTYQCSVTN